MKFSLNEYTPEEKAINGNGMYGGKRHDEICDYLQSSYNFSEKEINDISMGIWLAIDAEKAVNEAKLQVAVEFIEMVEDHRKMPHQHIVAYDRINCLNNLATETLTKIKAN